MSFSATKDQAKCLDDVPAPVARYDFLRQGQRPGEQFKGGKISEYFSFLSHLQNTHENRLVHLLFNDMTLL